MFEYPQFDPVAFAIGPLQVRWYGLMYLFGFVLAWLGMRSRARRADSPVTQAQVSDLVFYAAVGLILGEMVETNLQNSLKMFEGQWWLIAAQPLAALFLVLAVLGLSGQWIFQRLFGGRR